MNEAAQAAERYAAELIAKLGQPDSYDKAVAMLAIAYLEGGAQQLTLAMEKVSA